MAGIAKARGSRAAAAVLLAAIPFLCGLASAAPAFAADTPDGASAYDGTSFVMVITVPPHSVPAATPWPGDSSASPGASSNGDPSSAGRAPLATSGDQLWGAGLFGVVGLLAAGATLRMRAIDRRR